MWKEVLKSMCEEYGIIAGTYNMEEMTLQDLKKAACRPEVWMSFLRRHRSATYPTFGGTIPRLSPIIHMPQAGYDRMTAGGRFLIRVMEEYPTSTLEILDLGMPAKSDEIVRPRCIAEQAINTSTNCALIVTSSTTRKAVLVSVTQHDEARNVYR